MTVISRRQYDHPVLGAAGGSGLHASIQTLYLVLGNDSQSRYVSYSAVANSAVNSYAHNFGVTFAELNIAIYTGTYPNLILVADPVAAGYTIVGTPGNLKTSLDVTAPSSGGPHTFNLLIQHGQPASSTMPGAVSTGAQTFAGPKTFSSTIVGSISGNAATVTTNANLTGEVTSVGNAATLLNSAVIGKVLTGYVSGAGTVSATDSILQAFQKINGNDALKAPLASPTFTGTVTTADLTAAGNCIFGSASAATTVPQFLSNGETQVKIISAGTNNRVYLRMTSTGTGTARIFTPNTTGLEFTGSADTALGSYTNAGAWTFGPSSGSSIEHIFQSGGETHLQINSSSANNARLQSMLSAAGTSFIMDVRNTVDTGTNVVTNFVNYANTAGSLAFSTRPQFAWSNYTTQLGVVSAAGDWTLGPAAQNATHIINGLTTLQRANGTSYSGVAFPPNAITTYINSTNSGTVSQVFAVRDVSTVAQYMSFTTYSPANAQVDFVMQSTLSGTTKEILRATGAGAWAFGPAVTGNRTGQRHLVSGALYASNVTSTDESGIFVLGVNTRIGSNTAEDGRTETTTGGIAIRLENRTVASSQAIGFYSNQPGDTTSTAATVIGNATHAGAWTFGPSGFAGMHTLRGTVQHGGTGTSSTVYWVQTGGTTSSDIIIDARTGTNASALQVKGDTSIAFANGSVSSVGAWTWGSTTSTSTHLMYGSNLTIGTTIDSGQTPQVFTIQHAGATTGTNNPGANLTIKGSASTGSVAGGSIIFQTTPAGGSGASVNAHVTVGQTTAAGSWTLGALSSAAQLDVLSSTSSATTGNGPMQVRSNGTTSNQIFIECYYSATTSSGGIRRSTTTQTPEFFSGSDRRIKQDFQEYEPQLAKICNIQLHRYGYKNDNTATGRGPVAQELHTIYPDKVAAPDDGLGDSVTPANQWSIGSDWNWELVKAIQELSAKNDALEARIYAIEN